MARRRNNDNTAETNNNTEERSAPLKPTEIPAEGISGTFNGTFTGTSKQGRPFTIHNISGTGLFGSKALDEEMSSLNKGDQVSVKYLGKKSLKNKNGDSYSMHTFDVAVED